MLSLTTILKRGGEAVSDEHVESPLGPILQHFFLVQECVLVRVLGVKGWRIQTPSLIVLFETNGLCSFLLGLAYLF
jgi:hypothetical protein